MGLGTSITQIGKTLTSQPVEGILRYQKGGERHYEIPPLSESNFCFYIGQLLKNRNKGVYTDEFLKGSVQSLLEYIPEGKKLVIVDGGELGRILNGDIPALAGQEQSQYLKKLLQNYGDRVEIIKVEDKHPELFEFISSPGWIQKIAKIQDDDTMSLGIFKKLFQLYNENEDFREKVEATIPEKLSEEKIESRKYYTLVELAFRLHDFFSGIEIHGGYMRQSKYDHIIQLMLQGEYGSIFPVENENTFQTLYFNKERYSQEQARVREKTRTIIRGVGGVSGAILLAVLTILGSQQISKMRGEQEIQSGISTMISSPELQELCNIFKSMRDCVTKQDEKKFFEVIKTRVEDYTEFIRKNYLLGQDSISDNELRKMVISTLTFLVKNFDVKSIPGFYRKDIEYSSVGNREFAERYFFPNHLLTFQNAGVTMEQSKDGVCFGVLCSQREAFRNSFDINSEEEFLKLFGKYDRALYAMYLGKSQKIAEITSSYGVPLEIYTFDTSVRDFIGPGIAGQVKPGKKYIVASYMGGEISYEKTKEAVQMFYKTFYVQNLMQQIVRFSSQFLLYDREEDFLKYLIESGKIGEIQTLQNTPKKIVTTILEVPQKYLSQQQQEEQVKLREHIQSTQNLDLTQIKDEQVKLENIKIVGYADFSDGRKNVYFGQLNGGKIIFFSRDIITNKELVLAKYIIEDAQKFVQKIKL